jgi:hypothetical protein
MNVTDPTMPGPDSADAPIAPAAQPPAQLPDAPPPDAPPRSAAQAGKKRPVIIIGVIVAFLAIVLFAVRNNVAADDLKVGDCFNTTDKTTFQTVETQPCTQSHNAEVIFIGEYSGDTYPISLSLNRYIDDSCVPAFESYVGRAIDSEPALSIGYFYPDRDGWNSGDRTITCYLAQPDKSPMTKSLKG